MKAIKVIIIALALMLLALAGFSQCRDISYNFRETYHGNIQARDADTTSIHIDEDNGQVVIMEWAQDRFSMVRFKIIARLLETSEQAEWLLQIQEPGDTQPLLYAYLISHRGKSYSTTYMRGGTTLIFDNDFLKSLKMKKCRHQRASHRSSLTELTVR